jgi:hypothetical protein
VNWHSASYHLIRQTRKEYWRQSRRYTRNNSRREFFALYKTMYFTSCAVTQADGCRRRGSTKNQPPYKSAKNRPPYKSAGPIANQVSKHYCFFIMLKFTTASFFFANGIIISTLFRIIHKSRNPWGSVLHLPKEYSVCG